MAHHNEPKTYSLTFVLNIQYYLRLRSTYKVQLSGSLTLKMVRIEHARFNTAWAGLNTELPPPINARS